ncbi:hypothetical protein [Lysinibacillus sp. fls2-241-R2A-57]|uniref:hypothetical protein n=1 Tax=Lysinibacillus sp. fls2-241-R2A-57 TaxID=3040292 RepID=UPI002555AF43|nr:hypothetical protein [Lysinibacillus sp. fls2-241-R2A-57]
MFSVAKAKRQRQMFSVAKAKRQRQSAQPERKSTHVMLMSLVKIKKTKKLNSSSDFQESLFMKWPFFVV